MYCLDHHLSDMNRISWEQWTDKQTPITWRIDPDKGVVQGPLDLCFLDGRTLHLVLNPGQVALLTARGEQRAFFPDGAYLLGIGANGLPADGLMYFMHTEQSLRITWEQVIPVPPVAPGSPATRRASGSFDVRIESPIRFYQEMLRNHAGEGESICYDMLSRIMPTLLTIRLAQACGPGATIEDQRTALTTLHPEDLAVDLAPYGLGCTAMEIDESFLPADRTVTVPT